MGGGDLPGWGWGPGVAAERSSGRRSSPGSAVHFSPARRQPWARHSPPRSITAWWWGREWGGAPQLSGGLVRGTRRSTRRSGHEGRPVKALGLAQTTESAGPSCVRPKSDRDPQAGASGLWSRSLRGLWLSLPLQTSASPSGLGAPVPPKAPPDASAPLDRGPRRRRRARPALRLPLPVTCTREPRSPGAPTRASTSAGHCGP